MGKQPPHRHGTLTVTSELRPVRADWRIQVEQAFPDELTSHDRYQPLGAGEDHCWRVVLPQLVR